MGATQSRSKRVRFEKRERKLTILDKPKSTKPKSNEPTNISRSTTNEVVKKAVLIGLNYTGTRFALRGCINDANRMKRTLISSYGYIEQNVNVLTDKNLNIYNNILQILSELVLSKSKNLFFQYSGHGTQVRDTNGDEKDGMDEALFSVCGTLITDDQINEVVKKVPSGTSMVCVIDACHSGTVMDLPYHFIGGQLVKINDDQFNGNIVSISGCRDDQVSMDVSSGAISYGAMSNCLQIVLKQTEKKTITWRELIILLNTELTNRKFVQMPQLSLSKPELLDSPVYL
jgi:hypothetical protein